MKPGLSLILLASFVSLSASAVVAQSETDAVIRAEKLRLQLIEVQTKESALQVRAQQLDEDLKPENIERALAGIGSTRPEELREQRRRQLQFEKDRVLEQLKQLAKTRTDLESAILTAEAEVYQQSAQGPSRAQLDQMVGSQFAVLPPWVVGVSVVLLSVLGLIALILIIRRISL